MKIPPHSALFLSAILSFCLVSRTFSADTLPNSTPMPDSIGLELWAEVDEAAPSITLRFLFVDNFSIYRREYGGTAWMLMTNSTGANTASWTDTTAVPGKIYEYAVCRDLMAQPSGSSKYGYALAGINVDKAVPRGTIILVLAENIIEQNSSRIRQLYEDLVGDGWKVKTIYAPYFNRTAFAGNSASKNYTLGLWGHRYVETIRNRIRAIYDADPQGVKLVYLLGHTPIAISGIDISHSDQHANRTYYPTDHYFVDVDGVWTDKKPNPEALDLVANLPGDGMWDQNTLPSKVEMGIGRVDPWDRTGAQWLGLTEADLVARYLDKAHKYRHNLPFGNPGQEMLAGGRAMVRGPAGQAGASHASGQFLNIVGPQNMRDYVSITGLPAPVAPNTDGDVQATIDYGPFLFWGQSTGGPQDDDIYRRSVFNHACQSYWSDWHIYVNMRKQTMNDGMVLSWLYTGRFDGQLFLYPMGVAEPLGSVMKLSANYEEREIFEGTEASAQNSNELRELWRALLADPALRAFVVPPVTNLAASEGGAGIELRWSPPSDISQLVEYRVSRANDLMGNFQFVGAVSGTAFTDAGAPAGPKVYMVQAVHHAVGGSGSLLVNSQGLFASVGLQMETAVLPPFPVGEDASFSFVASGFGGSPAWSVVKGQLPAGMGLSPEGLLSGNPVLPGEYPVTVRATAGGYSVDREFVVFVDAAFSEVIEMDLREAGGLGLYDRAMPGRPVSTMGDAHLDPQGGMYFDGDGDALRLHNMGELTSGTWSTFSYTPGNVKHFSVSLSFKAEPGSPGGVLISKSANIDSLWSSNLNHFTIRLLGNGTVQAWQRQRTPAASGPGLNDGKWHSVTFGADPASGEANLYVDGAYVGKMTTGDKNPMVDLLVGARWLDAGNGTITDAFRGWVADLRYTSSEVTAGEAKAIYERLVRTRGDLSPTAPQIVGLPASLDLYSGKEAILPFTVLDGHGQPVRDPVRPFAFVGDEDSVQSVEVLKTSSGYALKVIASEDEGGASPVTVAIDGGYPGLVGKQVLNYRRIGAVADQFHVPAASASELDVLANDVFATGRTHVLDGIVQQPVYADDQAGQLVGGVKIVGGKVRFYPPPLWQRPIQFSYRLLDPASGESDIATVTLIPKDPPVAANDEYVFRGDEPGSLDVLSNDSDPNHEVLSLIAVTQPNIGSVRIEDGMAIYSPNIVGSSGSTTFSYTVKNQSGAVASAMVTLLLGGAGSPPLADLSMEEGSGTAVANGGSLGGQWNLKGGSAAWVQGPDGLALDFPDDNGRIDLGNDPSLRFNPATDSFSVVAAVETSNFDSTGNFPMTLITKGDSDLGNVPLAVKFESDSVVVYLKGQRIVAGQCTPSAKFGEILSQMGSSAYKWWNTGSGLTRWRAFSVINDAENKRLKIYVSQFLVADVDTSALDIDVGDNGANWIIGASPNGSGFNEYLKGAIDNVRIYDWAIRPEEIRQQFRELGFRVKQLEPQIFNVYPSGGRQLELNKTYRFTAESLVGVPDEAPGEYAISTGVIYPVGQSPVRMGATINTVPGDFRMTSLVAETFTNELLVTPDRLGSLIVKAYLRPVQDPDLPEASSSTQIGGSLSFTVVSSAPAIPDKLSVTTPVNLGSVPIHQISNIALAAAGGATPYTWKIISGKLPTGMSLDSGSGGISGTPVVKGSFTFSIRVTDSAGIFADRGFNLAVGSVDLDGNKLPDDWELEYLGGTAQNPAGDANGDGLPDLLNFAMGFDLPKPSMRQHSLNIATGIGPSLNGQNQYLLLEFRRRRELGSLRLQPQLSEDLVNWTPVSAAQETVLEDDGEVQKVQWMIPFQMGKAIFGRLQAD